MGDRVLDKMNRATEKKNVWVNYTKQQENNVKKLYKAKQEFYRT